MEEQRAEIQRLAEHQRLLESRLAGVEQKKHQLRLLEEQLKRIHIQKEVGAGISSQNMYPYPDNDLNPSPSSYRWISCSANWKRPRRMRRSTGSRIWRS